MKMRKVLAGILLAAMVLACVPAGPEGSTAVQAAQVTSTPDVTVTAPVIGQAPANAVLTTSGGLETTATVTTQNMTVDEEGGISGRITAANADNAVFNVTGTTKLLLHLQLKPEKTSQKQSIIGKMNAQYGLQIEGSTLLLFGKLSEGWYQVNYTIPNDAWYNE